MSRRMNEQQFRQVVDFFNDKHLEQKPETVWNENTLANIPRMSKERSIWRLEGKHADDAIIVVGASPSLLKCLPALADLENNPRRKNFVIIVVNSALKPCLNAGVKPDYVIAIDGNPETIVGDLDCDNDNLTLIASNNVAPKIFDVWKGKEIWWSPYYCLSKEVTRKVKPLLGLRMPSGGNAFSAALGIAYMVFNSRIYIMVGAEHCYDDRYYAHKKSRWEENNEKIAHWKVTDIKGRNRWTNIPLWQYKIWIEHMANDLPEFKFVDTSYGILGTDTDNIKHCDIDEAIKRTAKAYDIVEQIKGNKILSEKLRYDAAYGTGHYFPEAGIGFWRKLLKRTKLDGVKKILDVGCGAGQVVAHLRNNGYEAYGIDIADGARKYWRLANVEQFCQVAPANTIPFPDKEFDIVCCTEVLEHVPEEVVLDTLKEMYRVGGGDFIFSCALKRAVVKMPHDGSEPHITIKSVDWWIAKLKEAGFVIISLILHDSQAGCIFYCRRGIKDAKGKLPISTMHIQSKSGVLLVGNFARMESGTGFSGIGNQGVR